MHSVMCVCVAQCAMCVVLCVKGGRPPPAGPHWPTLLGPAQRAADLSWAVGPRQPRRQAATQLSTCQHVLTCQHVQ